MPLNERDNYIYLAGIIDGEGCIRVNNAPRIHVTNTSKELIDWLYDTFGGYIWIENGSYIENAKPRFMWEISGDILKKVVCEIEPFLIIKKRQANLVIDYYSTIIHRKRGNGEKLLVLKRKLQSLNHKGIINKLENKYAAA